MFMITVANQIEYMYVKNLRHFQMKFLPGIDLLVLTHPNKSIGLNGGHFYIKIGKIIVIVFGQQRHENKTEIPVWTIETSILFHYESDCAIKYEGEILK